MKISRSWLQDYVDLAGLSGEAIAQAITFLGFEVEGVVVTGAPALSNVVVGEVLTRDQHPNADRLSICTVAVGEAQGGTKRIVCGAQNYRVGGPRAGRAHRRGVAGRLHDQGIVDSLRGLPGYDVFGQGTRHR
jgi:predicted RNA-binding protein with EMAP domain